MMDSLARVFFWASAIFAFFSVFVLPVVGIWWVDRERNKKKKLQAN